MKAITNVVSEVFQCLKLITERSDFCSHIVSGLPDMSAVSTIANRPPDSLMLIGASAAASWSKKNFTLADARHEWEG
jgi:hypothetical protein